MSAPKLRSAIYRKVSVSSWNLVGGLSDPARLLYFWLRTSQFSSPIPGICVAGRAAIAEENGWATSKVDRAMKELSSRGLAEADFDARIVRLPKAIEESAPDNENQVKGWARYWELAPESPVKDRHRADLRAFVGNIDPSWTDAFDKACPPNLGGNVTPNLPPNLGGNQAGTGGGGGSGGGEGKGNGGGGGIETPPPPPALSSLNFGPDRTGAIAAMARASAQHDRTPNPAELDEHLPRIAALGLEAFESLFGRFHARAGRNAKDTHWRDCRWSLHTFFTQAVPLFTYEDEAEKTTTAQQQETEEAERARREADERVRAEKQAAERAAKRAAELVNIRRTVERLEGSPLEFCDRHASDPKADPRARYASSCLTCARGFLAELEPAEEPRRLSVVSGGRP